MQHLPQRDWWLIPAISIVTIATMFVGAEAVSRAFFPTAADGCWVRDPVYYARNRPNCRSKEKLAEGPWVTDQYNACGYRSPEPCGPKPPGTTRIALIGSSFAEGHGVNYNQAFASLSERRLTEACRRRVEIQNLAVSAITPINYDRRMQEALRLDPDLVLLVVTPFDVFSSLYTDQEMAERKDPKPIAAEAGRTPKNQNKLAEFKYMLQGSRATTVALHYLYQNQARYLKLFLNYGDHADYLRPPFKPMWEKRFERLDVLLGDMADEAHARGVPIALAGGITAPMAAALSESQLPPGIDAHAFEARMEEIAARHGITYLNVYPEFERQPHASRLFYLVDGHLAASGQTVYSRALVSQLLEKDIPAFAGCSLSQQNYASAGQNMGLPHR